MVGKSIELRVRINELEAALKKIANYVPDYYENDDYEKYISLKLIAESTLEDKE